MGAVANHNPDNSHLPQGGSSGGPSHGKGDLGKRFEQAFERTAMGVPAVAGNTARTVPGPLLAKTLRLVLSKLG
jgi:hypothetical protein